ncbi:hypothetical protein MJN51_35890, partial [Salmonella enterica subsp. enterica serovar Kentucky]|nr:hypothetical protein [Salmonella enterica subsp. enterica serovar Kentucky]
HTASFAEIEAARGDISLTYFEYGTLSALWLFKQANLDVVILDETLEGSKGKVQLLGSGSILRHVREAAQILAKDYGVGSDVYSV